MSRVPILVAVGALALAACAGPRSGPDPALRPADAAEQARREERLKLMELYWRAHTGETPAGADSAALPQAGPPLSYPAGKYDGVFFAARVADDPGLAEPPR